MNKEYKNMSLYVAPLVENETTWNALKNRYPQILADLTSARSNPTCSCRGRVGSYLQERSQALEEANFIKTLITNPEVFPQIQKIEEEFTSRQEAQKNFPKRHTVGKSVEEWNAFVKYLEDNKFKDNVKSFSVVEKEHQLDVYLM